jgi:hypothetical protein
VKPTENVSKKITYRVLAPKKKTLEEEQKILEENLDPRYHGTFRKCAEETNGFIGDRKEGRVLPSFDAGTSFLRLALSCKTNEKSDRSIDGKPFSPNSDFENTIWFKDGKETSFSKLYFLIYGVEIKRPGWGGDAWFKLKKV